MISMISFKEKNLILTLFWKAAKRMCSISFFLLIFLLCVGIFIDLSQHCSEFGGDGSLISERDKLTFHFWRKWSWNYSFELVCDCSSSVAWVSCWLHTASAWALIENWGRSVAHHQIHLSSKGFSLVCYERLSHSILFTCICNLNNL